MSNTLFRNLFAWFTLTGVPLNKCKSFRLDSSLTGSPIGFVVTADDFTLSGNCPFRVASRSGTFQMVNSTSHSTLALGPESFGIAAGCSSERKEFVISRYNDNRKLTFLTGARLYPFSLTFGRWGRNTRACRAKFQDPLLCSQGITFLPNSLVIAAVSFLGNWSCSSTCTNHSMKEVGRGIICLIAFLLIEIFLLSIARMMGDEDDEEEQ